MGNWQDHILRHFEPGAAQLTLVHDPDLLITEESILSAIVDRGHDVLAYEDPIAFRYAYETQYRQQWDAGAGRSLVVAVQSGEDLDSLPFDLLRRGRRLHFTLHDIFPALNYPVIQELDRALLDALSTGYERHDGTQLGERTTKEFVLLHCYGVSPRLIRTPVDLLRFLLDRHYADRVVPEALDELLLETIKQEPALEAFPLEPILADRGRFLDFIQHQWEAFVLSSTGGGGDCIVPFGHDSIRVYMDSLFIEGLLEPVEVAKPDGLPDWVRFGVVRDAQRDDADRLRDLLVRVEEQLPTPGASHRDWLRFATLWAEASVVKRRLLGSSDAPDGRHHADLQAAMEERFAEWMLTRFGSLQSLPAHPQPVMVSQITRHLSALRNRGELGRFALIVLDGLALDQWNIVRRELEAERAEWSCEVTQLFTWVPSLTPVCRQAIFAGDAPMFFPESLGTTKGDEARWRKYWEDVGLHRAQVGYRLAKLVRDEADLGEFLSDPNLEAVGIVLSDIDEMVHGAVLGMQGVHHQLRLWMDRGHLVRLLEHLGHEGFTVFITSDHGNTVAEGVGTPREGVLVDTRGSRARVYTSKELRKAAAANIPDAIEWTGSGLPPGYEVLLAGGLTAFAPQGKQIVTHGGISLEEMIVPFVRLQFL